MLANFSVAGELAQLIQLYLDTHKATIPELETLLAKRLPGGRLPIALWWQALSLMQEHFSLPHVGLELGKMAQPVHSGALGYLIPASANVLQALDAFQRYQRILYEGATSSFSATSHHIHIEWPLDYGYSTRASDDTLFAGLVTFIRRGTGNADAHPQRVGFIHAKPDDMRPYDDFFQCDVVFNQANNFITFAAKLGATPMLYADAGLVNILSEKIDSDLAQMPQTEVFLRWFYQHLLMAMGEGEPTVKNIAQRMAISPRTLFRRLQSHQLHFNDVLASTRRQLAQQYLRDGLAHAEIAQQLGYSDQSAFSRAFKAWTGITPLAFQKTK